MVIPFCRPLAGGRTYLHSYVSGDTLVTDKSISGKYLVIP